MNPVVLLFIDGVGIGEKDEINNPFFKYGSKFFNEVFGRVPVLDDPVIEVRDGHIFPVDARMGIAGLPQSGTGQASIFCGFNAPAFVGKHFGPYPYSTTIPIIKEQNIFIEFIRKGYNVSFINAYPNVFFDYISSGRQRLSVTTLSCSLNNIRLNSDTEVKNKTALTAEITNERWNRRLGYELEVITPALAADILLKAAAENDLTVYEYFLTDHFGHGRYNDELVQAYYNLDNFLYSLLTKLDVEKYTLLICSDHGNFENTGTKSHTLNPSLGVSYGKHSKFLFQNIKDLSQIKQTLINIQDFP